MTWKVFLLASGIAVTLAGHTSVGEHSGCSQSGAIQPIPYVPLYNDNFVDNQGDFEAWKSTLTNEDVCTHKPNAAENKRGKENLRLGDFLVIKWEFESSSQFASDPTGTANRPSGFLRADFDIYVNLGCKYSNCNEPATPYGSGEVLFPFKLEIQDSTGVQPRLRYIQWTPPAVNGDITDGITVANPAPNFPDRPVAMNAARYDITNLALVTDQQIPFNVNDELGTICMATGTFILAVMPEIGSFQTKVEAFQDNGVWVNGEIDESEATFLSIMVINSRSCSNVPPELESTLSGVSQILVPPDPPPPSAPPLAPPAPPPCPGMCVQDCADYAVCISTGGVDCQSNVPAKCFLPDSESQPGCAEFSRCYYPCTKGVTGGIPPVTATCSKTCSDYLVTPDMQCLPNPPPPPSPCPDTCVELCAGYSKCIATELSVENCKAKFPPICVMPMEATPEGCDKFSKCYYPCTKGKYIGDGPAAIGPQCSSECSSYLTPKCLPPPPKPCPPQCFEMCKDYAACKATLGVGCESLAMSKKCYTDWVDECETFYECYFPCTENKHKPKVSGSCSSECASYLVPNCFPFTVSKDPHFQLPHGGRADFRGEDNAIFNLLSAKNVSMNVLIADADFSWNKRTVHGTKMSAAYWVVRTEKNKIIRIEYNTTAKGAVVYESGSSSPIILTDEHQEFVRDNLHVKFIGKNKLRVKTEKWEMAASKSPFPFPNLNRGKVLLDVEITALYDADSDVVAPHGIFGQAYDGDKLAVDGAVDSDRGTVTTTKAQAEGAIEGTWTDYKVASKFAVSFKYGRFDAVTAKHRDVSQLTGIKHAAAKGQGKAISLPV